MSKRIFQNRLDGRSHEARPNKRWLDGLGKGLKGLVSVGGHAWWRTKVKAGVSSNRPGKFKFKRMNLAINSKQSA